MAESVENPTQELAAAVAEEMQVDEEQANDAVEENGVVKEEPVEGGLENGGGGDVTEKRQTRKVQIKFRDFDSDESEEEKIPVKRARTARTPRGGKANKAVPENMADPKRTPCIVLQNMDNDSPAKAPSRRGRGRGRGAATKTPGSAGRGRAKKPKKEESDDDFEEEEEEDDEDLVEEDDDDGDWSAPKQKKPARGRGRGGGRGRGAPRGRKPGKTPPKPRKAEEDEEEEEEEDEEGEEENNQSNNIANASEEDDPNDPTAVRVGHFLMEKVDLRHQENYPVWRLEGPNMLRKFEMTVTKGKILHKSLFAYSSWAQSMIDQYNKIKVAQVTSSDGDMVKVLDEFVPAPPVLERLETYRTDPLYAPYCVLLKALFRQVLDSNFLKSIKETQDLEYLNPISTFDTAIGTHVRNIESAVNMKEEFMSRVKNCPNMKSIKRQNWAQTDQATTDKCAEKGVRSILMFGFGYEPFNMSEEKTRGVEVAQELVIGSTMDQYLDSYHGLFHFKFQMLKRCQDKMKLVKGLNLNLSDEEALKSCMDDEAWILQTFEDLKLLIQNERSPQPEEQPPS